MSVRGGRSDSERAFGDPCHRSPSGWIRRGHVDDGAFHLVASEALCRSPSEQALRVRLCLSAGQRRRIPVAGAALRVLAEQGDFDLFPGGAALSVPPGNGVRVPKRNALGVPRRNMRRDPKRNGTAAEPRRWQSVQDQPGPRSRATTSLTWHLRGGCLRWQALPTLPSPSWVFLSACGELAARQAGPSLVARRTPGVVAEDGGVDGALRCPRRGPAQRAFTAGRPRSEEAAGPGIRPMASVQVRLRLAISSESCCTWAGSASRARAT